MSLMRTNEEQGRAGDEHRQGWEVLADWHQVPQFE